MYRAYYISKFIWDGGGGGRGGASAGCKPDEEGKQNQFGNFGYNKQNNNIHEYIVRMRVEHEGE